MRHYVITSLLICLVFHAGYAISETVSEYIPLQDGNKWTYRTNGTYGVYEKSIYVIPGFTQINGVATKAVQVLGGPYDRDKEYWTNDEGGIRVHGGYTPFTEIGSGTVILEPPMLVANSEMNIGETVSSTGKARFTFSGYGTFLLDYQSSFTLNEITTVTVPSGTYETVRYSGYYRMYGPILGEQFDDTTTITRWLARNIGAIKDTYADIYASETNVLLSTNVKIKPPFLPFLPLLLD